MECWADFNKRVIPIVIGATVVGLFLIIVLTFLFVKDRRRQGYDRLWARWETGWRLALSQRISHTLLLLQTVLKLLLLNPYLTFLFQECWIFNCKNIIKCLHSLSDRYAFHLSLLPLLFVVIYILICCVFNSYVIKKRDSVLKVRYWIFN